MSYPGIIKETALEKMFHTDLSLRQPLNRGVERPQLPVPAVKIGCLYFLICIKNSMAGTACYESLTARFV